MKAILSGIGLAICSLGVFAADEIVARMGTLELTATELRQIIENEGGENLLTGLNAAQLGRLARIEIVRRKVAADARAQGWDKRAQVIARMKRASETALVSSYVGSLARPPAGYPTADDVRAAFDANREKFNAPARYRVAQIFVATGPDEAKAESRARDLGRDAAKKGADFAELARKNSDHAASARRGGDLGWIPEEQVIPELKGVLAGMKPGEVSKPIKATRGWHIVRLAEFKAAGLRPFEEVRDTIAQALRLKKAREAEAQFLEGLIAKTPVAVNESVLQQLMTGK